jgi:hypothetical protein
LLKMSRVESLIGKKFGKLTVIKEHPVRKNKRVQWVCKCDCGNETNVVTYRLNNGETRSCGCLQKSKFNLVGMRFGKLVVTKKHPDKNKYDAVQWYCKCDCGNIIVSTTSHLREGTTISCGNHRGTHRNAIKGNESTEYGTWLGMRSRCNDKENPSYKDYGGRNIKVCTQWDSFENFLNDMGKKPDHSFSIERIDNDKGYYPENCIWADRTVQNRNQRIRKNNSSGITGVNWNIDANKWVVRITVDYKRIHIGYFSDLNEAKEARKKAEAEYWGK